MRGLTDEEAEVLEEYARWPKYSAWRLPVRHLCSLRARSSGPHFYSFDGLGASGVGPIPHPGSCADCPPSSDTARQARTSTLSGRNQMMVRS